MLGLPAASLARFEFQDGDPRQPGDGGNAVAPPGAKYDKLNWLKVRERQRRERERESEGEGGAGVA